MEELKKIETPFINIFNEQNSPAIIMGTIDDIEDKKVFYNAIVNCQEDLKNHINEPIDVKAIYIDRQLIKNDNDAGKHEAPRIIIMTTDNNSFITFSGGVYYSLKKLTEVFGTPPYEFKIACREINRGKMRILTIEIYREQ